VSLDNVSKKLSLKKSSVISDTFVGSEGIYFTPGFPVKQHKLGVLSSFTHVVAPKFEVSLLSSHSVPGSLFAFHCNFVLGAQFFFLLQNHPCHTHLLLNYPQAHCVNCQIIILEDSHLTEKRFPLGDSSVLATWSGAEPAVD
jgi:hypothetical protein